VTSAAGRAGGLRLDSVIMTDNVATVFETEIDSVLGRWPDMASIDAALKHTLAIT
jgi:mRNA interferase MazF